MSIRYNHSLIGKNGRINAYLLEKEGILSGSTLHAIYHDRPIRTDTLLRILEYTDCALEDFLLPKKPGKHRRRRHFRIDLAKLAELGIISDIVCRYYRNSRPMSLATLDTIAGFYDIEIHDLIMITTCKKRGREGHLKKCRKMIYLTEY